MIPFFAGFKRWIFRWMGALILSLGAVWISAPNGSAAPIASRNPLRVGLYHPHPRWCPGEEPSQRDLRVLRLAWRVGVTAGAWRAGPSYLRPTTGIAGTGWSLDTQLLWGKAESTISGRHPEFIQGHGPDRLALWRVRVAAQLPGIEAAAWTSLAQFVVENRSSPWSRVFLPSRMGGFDQLPWLKPVIPGREGVDSRFSCRSWPRWVRWVADVGGERGDTRFSYRMRLEGIGKEGALEVRGYLNRRTLWRDYLRGRLDALLLEGPDFDARLRRRRANQVGRWGVVSGGQQLVLRWQGASENAPGLESRIALSQALNRRLLAKRAGVGGFAPLRHFLTPWIEAEALPAAPALQWNALDARRRWLKTPQLEAPLLEAPQSESSSPHPVPWRLTVLDHPVLKAVAEGIQAQWRRTLNRELSIKVVPYESFALSKGRERLSDTGWVLDVVDMDNGSLQDLWVKGLPPTLRGEVVDPKAIEERLRNRIPYIPLIGNVHWVVLKKNAPATRLSELCPGCRFARSPVRLRAKAVERVNTEG